MSESAHLVRVHHFTYATILDIKGLEAFYRLSKERALRVFVEFCMAT